jgi:dihydroflavonol-4-reductase
MKIFVTGASGFVGAHSARLLHAAGHELHLLARQPERLLADLARHGLAAGPGTAIQVLPGDMCDRVAVERAAAGCDAVLHAAASVALSAGHAQQTLSNNVDGLRSVVGTALAQGIGNIVYVSSLSVLFTAGAARMDEDSPLASGGDPYSRSKCAGEVWARELQAQGAPIQIVYPSAVVGPDDPGLSKGNQGVREFVTLMPPNTSSGFQCVDVRDLAAAHRFLLERPPTGDPQAARYVVGGHFLRWQEIRTLLQSLTGRRKPSPPIPGALLRAFGHVVDAVNRLVPFETNLTAEAMAYATRWPPADSTRFQRMSGLGFRPPDQTYADTLRWMQTAGHLTARQLGILARPDGLRAVP